MNNVKVEFKAYFDRLLTAWKTRFSSLPKTSIDEDVSPTLVVGEPDEDEMVEWMPKEIENPNATIPADVLEIVTSETAEYFTAYWFLSIGGKFGKYLIQLNQNTPESVRDELPGLLERYRDAHGAKLTHVPVGVESRSGLLVVMGNTPDDNAIYLEDYEASSFEKIAATAAEFLRDLNP